MKCSSLKYSESEPKILSWGGLLSLLPVLRLTSGPHPLATTVTILGHLCIQFNQ
jgi:hypothetical protein